MEDFMDPMERVRAQTYYKQMQQDREDKMCKFCDKQITQREMENSNCTMLQSTECFHQVHVDCLRDKTVELKSENKEVKCPRCKEQISEQELKAYLQKEQIDEIDKNVQMNFVKENPNMVSCSCGNIMEMLPG